MSEVDYLTNVGILELDTVPEHLVIIGGSYIGLEFAQMYRRFGAEVTVVERGPRLAPREDDDVCSASIKDILENDAITIHLGANDIRVWPRTVAGISVGTSADGSDGAWFAPPGGGGLSSPTPTTSDLDAAGVQDR